MKKYIVQIILAIIICLIIVVFLPNIGNKKTKIEGDYYKGLPVTISYVSFLYDTSTPEKAIGVSDYVFIAKINKILRTEYKNPTEENVNFFQKRINTSPYTVYSIDVVENIKGNLTTTESIEYMQYGGLNEDRKGYTFMNETTLLNEGEYYILMVSTFGGDGGTIEVTEPNRRIPLGKNYSLKLDIVNKYKEACKNEIIPLNENGEQYQRNISKYDVNYVDK